jgi:D-inositol-3-phosphate glycosyltransferase
MKRLAILSVHTSPIAPPGGKKVGGMNTYVREIAQEFGRQGITVDIFTRRVSACQPQIDTSLGENVNVIHVSAGMNGKLFPIEIYAHLQEFTSGVIAYTIRQNIQYDLIFSHYWLSGWVAQSLKETWGTPFVQMFHTLAHLKNQIPSVASHEPEVRTHTETEIVQWADMIITNTPDECKQLVELYHANPQKICVCPPGVNIDRFQPTSVDSVRDEIDIPHDANLLLFVGRIEPLKAVDSIIEALHVINTDTPDMLDNTYFAVIGGDPTDKADADMVALQQLTHDLGLSDKVRFLGAKDQDSLVKWYSTATMVLLPSEYESFGMVALEAMATGTPVIASNVGGLPFLVNDSQTGFLVPVRNPHKLANRIVDILKDPALQQEMGQNAAKNAQAYAWSSIAKRLVRAFSGLVRR